MEKPKSMPIPVEIANTEIEKYTQLRSAAISMLTTQFKSDLEKLTFHSSEFNSFVFERDDVLRFFLNDEDIPKEISEGKAELLMVIFGAHPGKKALEALKFKTTSISANDLNKFVERENEFAQGQPTVIVAGVNFHKGEENPNEMFSVLNTANPALEYPPVNTITKLFKIPNSNKTHLQFILMPLTFPIADKAVTDTQQLQQSQSASSANERHSRPISKADAEDELKMRLELYTNLSKIIDTLTLVVQKERPIVERFYSNPGNGFLFSRESVLRHFFKDPTKIDPDLFNDNTDLLAVLAAHDKEDTSSEPNLKIGDPTIIIAGVKENSDRTPQQINDGVHAFLFKTSGDPADEYPPIQTVTEIGKDFIGDSILLKFCK